MRIYLDNAATSWPKPDCVYDAVDRYQRINGAAAGRGAYRDAVEAQQVVAAARRGCAELLGGVDASRIVLTSNGTDALNSAIHGVLCAGDHVVATICEHNSVLRPIAAAREQLAVESTLVQCDATGRVEPDEVARALTSRTRLVAVTHASNVTGAIQPIRHIAEIVHQHDALLLVDAAQTIGHLPFDVELLGADLLAASGHKGLLGPLGTGLLYVGPGAEESLRPTRQGGTGLNSRSDRQPDRLPERYEAGNLNVPALAGLAAATQFLKERGVESIGAHEAALGQRLIDGLMAIEGASVHGPRSARDRTGVVSFEVAGLDPQELAALLDASASVQCRAGLHCAPLMHLALGTDLRGGSVRFSVGWATTAEQVDLAVSAIEIAIASV